MTVLLVDDQRVTSLPGGWGALVAHGRESWSWTLLDAERRVTGELGDARDKDGNVLPRATGVTGGSLTFNVNSDTRGAGSVTWTGRVEDQPDWVRVQIQPWFSLTGPDRSTVSWPMGVFLPSTPRISYGDGGWCTVQVDMYDRTLRLRQRALSSDPYVVPAGSGFWLVSFAREMVELALGQGTHAIEDSTDTARTPMTFMPGTTYYEVAAKVLEAAGFFAPWADGEGTIRSSRYAAPSSRPVVWEFADGDLASYTPDFEVEKDWFAIPNRILAYSQATGDVPPLEAEAYNFDPEDPLSITNRGFVDEVVEGVEAATLATLQAHAGRLLAERRSRGATVRLEHLPLPLTVNDRVNFRRDAAGLSLPGVVQTLDIDCSPGKLWRSTVREVAA